MKSLMTVQEASAQILDGKKLLIAGDEALLEKLPRGEWIGGTSPYFMSEEGGLCTREHLQATVLPDMVLSTRIETYEAGDLERIPRDYMSNGFSYVVIPAFTKAHKKFAQDCSTWEGVFDRPLVGWITGIEVKDVGRQAPKVVNGKSGEVSSSKAAVMHVELPPEIIARANIINLFSQGNGDIITFPASGFDVTECSVNGKLQSFAEYIEDRKIDKKLPLVADYLGAMVNVSIQSVNADTDKVSLYAPVFHGQEYKFASPVADYEVAFRKEIDARDIEPVFTCNCILNYLYANLEGKRTGHIVGPITFGEIAYMLLNQTLVYLTFESK
jgi:hypothetical protein